MGSGASATQQRYTRSASLSKAFSRRKAGQVLCNRCGQQVDSSKFELRDRPLCHKCGELCQGGLLYVCSVCDEIHKYSTKGGARARVCSTCASLTHTPNQACTRCGEVRKVEDTLSAQGRCAACLLSSSGLSDMQLSLPEEEKTSYGLAVKHCDTVKATSTINTPRTPALCVDHYASETSTTTTKTPRTPASRVEDYAGEKSTATIKMPRAPASRVVSASLDSNSSGVLVSNASRRTAWSVGSASLVSNPSGALTSSKASSRFETAALDSNPSGALSSNGGSATVMEVATASTSTLLTMESSLKTTLKDSIAVAEKSLPVGGARGLLLQHSSTSSLGSFKSVTLASAVTAKALLATTSQDIHRFRRRHEATRSTQPSASRSKTAPPKSKPESSMSSVTLPALAQTVNHSDRKVHPRAADPLTEHATDEYHIGRRALGACKKHKKLLRGGPLLA